MIWFTWRQFRAQAAITAGALVVLGALLFVTARSIAALYVDVAACQSDCGSTIDTFLAQVRASASGTLYNASLAVMYGVPALIGAFFGAPLIARELETGTHRLAWNQSVTRTRWLVTKLAVVGGAAVVAMGALSWAVTAWAQRIDGAAGDRITPLVYGARGIVPVGYALFAFALGVTVGMLIRRTVPAMAATLAVYVAAVAAMPLLARAHLVPAVRETAALDTGKLSELMISTNSGAMDVIGKSPANAWVVSNVTLTPTGQQFAGPADPTKCGRRGGPDTCEAWLGSLGLRQDLAYHPDSHFWPLQLAEVGVFVGLAALLIGFSFWWIRRRVA
jgi:ABC-type transport system involved in multi-copper enzyme maturation permease subunit